MSFYPVHTFSCPKEQAKTKMKMVGLAYTEESDGIDGKSSYSWRNCPGGAAAPASSSPAAARDTGTDWVVLGDQSMLLRCISDM